VTDWIGIIIALIFLGIARQFVLGFIQGYKDASAGLPYNEEQEDNDKQKRKTN
tara:strand:+ start:824 stop:982 length:159 start_codon:yes stop_codon:yes gene_type:complete